MNSSIVNMNKFQNLWIRNADISDSSLIADAVLNAIGAEIAQDLAGGNNSVEEVREIFRRLAERDDTQYSFKNTRIAMTENGDSIGVCISYDGEELIRLRRPFFKEAILSLGWKLNDSEIDSQPGETDPEEYYLDTLMVVPHFRGKGVARALIADAYEKSKAKGKPLGLLCDLDNIPAEGLYRSEGFVIEGLRPFAGKMMNHFRKY